MLTEVVDRSNVGTAVQRRFKDDGCLSINLSSPANQTPPAEHQSPYRFGILSTSTLTS